MTIGLISDTHDNKLDADVIEHLADCTEVWHAGDIGGIELAEYLNEKYTCRMVYGNIDGTEIKALAPLNESFELNGLKVFMTHIGGYPGRYTHRVKTTLEQLKPDLYICGHSHILKVVKDSKLGILHMNPGSCGHKGFHTFRTLLKFEIEDGEIKNLRAIDLGKRGAIKE